MTQKAQQMQEYPKGDKKVGMYFQHQRWYSADLGHNKVVEICPKPQNSLEKDTVVFPKLNLLVYISRSKKVFEIYHNLPPTKNCKSQKWKQKPQRGLNWKQLDRDIPQKQKVKDCITM